MFNKKSILVLFIDRNRFQFYGANFTGVETLDVPEAYLRDLDVVNHDGLYTLVKQWIKQHSLSGVQLILVFAETSYFEKVFSSAQPAEQETEIIKFLDAVPFESAITKVYDVPNGKRPVAINKALYEAIRQGFLLQGLPTKGAIPIFTLGALGTRRALDTEMGEYVLKNIDALLRQSLIEVQDSSAPSPQGPAGQMAAPAKKSNLPLLLGAFGVLLIILLVVVFLFR